MFSAPGYSNPGHTGPDMGLLLHESAVRDGGGLAAAESACVRVQGAAGAGHPSTP